jgi:hypothetical protein
VVTDQGVMSVDKKSKTATPVTTEGGGEVYGKTPSEVKISHVALNDNIVSVGKVKEVFKKGMVGPITGAARKFGAKFYSDEDFTKLKNRVAQLRTVIYGLSGKQINESEQVWLKEEILPNLQNPSENFETTLNEFEAWVTRRKGLMEGEYPSLAKTKKQESSNYQVGGMYQGKKILGINPQTKQLNVEGVGVVPY